MQKTQTARFNRKNGANFKSGLGTQRLYFFQKSSTIWSKLPSWGICPIWMLYTVIDGEALKLFSRNIVRMERPKHAFLPTASQSDFATMQIFDMLNNDGDPAAHDILDTHW